MIQLDSMGVKDSEFLGYLHSFRGVAILKIVLGHAVAAACIGAFGVFDVSNPVLMISEIFYHDSTLYFAIISGLLFSKVLKPKGYLKFYKSKLKNILLPYIFFTLVLTFFKINFDYFSGFQQGLEKFLSDAWVNFIYGKANFALWYIPVLIFLYLVTPILEYLQKTNRITKTIFLIIIFVPLFISRIQVLDEYNLRIETMIYFTGAYALGMFLGADLNKNLILLKKYRRQFILIAIISTVCLFYLYIFDIDLISIISLKETVFYVQKISFAFLIILMFKKLEAKQPIWLNPFARDSFSIYFIHGSILYAISPFFLFIIGAKQIAPFNIIIGALILFALVLFICASIVMVSRKIFGKHSRMIVGA